jgi:predicted DNA-binding protein
MGHRAIRLSSITATALAALALLMSPPAVAADGPQKEQAAETQPAEKKPDKPKPKFTISKETTYITEPLTEDGYPDYAGALNAIYGREVTPENNANVVFWKALGPRTKDEIPPEFFQLLGLPDPPEEGDDFIEFDTFLAEYHDAKPHSQRASALYDELRESRVSPWKAGAHPEIAEWLSRNHVPLELVVEGTRRPKYFSPLVVPKKHAGAGLTLVKAPGESLAREFGYALTARAMLRLGEGKSDKVWPDLLACHRLARHLGQGPLVAEYVTAISIEGAAAQADVVYLDRGAPNAEQVKACMRELHALQAFRSVAERLTLAERFSYLDAAVRVSRASNEEAIRSVAGQTPKSLARLLPSPIDWDTTLRMGNELYDRMDAAANESDRERRYEMWAAIETDVNNLPEFKTTTELIGFLTRGVASPRQQAGKLAAYELIKVTMPAPGPLLFIEKRTHQESANLRVAFALAGYRAHHGRYPEQLSELAPRYLKEFPGDIFSGQPLVYRATKEGYLLYSVGPNGKDDEGRAVGDKYWLDNSPFGDDLRVRIPSGK